MPEKPPGFLWRESTLLHEIVKEFTTAHMLQDEIAERRGSKKGSFHGPPNNATSLQILTDTFCSHKHQTGLAHGDVRSISLWQSPFPPTGQSMRECCPKYRTYFLQNTFGKLFPVDNLHSHLFFRDTVHSEFHQT